MPSRQRKQPENRRRTGCFQCKEKHVQCTEEKPSCKRCERLGLQCVRGIRLLFREDAIERGIHFGREGTWSKRCKRIKKPPVLDIDSDFTGIPLDPYFGKWIWLNTTYTDFSGDSDQWDNIEHATHWMLQVDDEQGPWTFAVDQNESCGEVKQQQQQQQQHHHHHHQQQTPYRIVHQPLQMRSLGNPLSYYPHSEAYLLDYFINAIGPNCSLSSSRNPYMLLIPLFSSTTLRNTILAVSANQLFLLGDTRYFREACLYKAKAVTRLTQVDGTSMVDFDIVASVLMLCFHDISDNCLPSWVTHLQGGLHMTPYLPARSAQQECLKRFFNMYFVGHDIMTRTAPIDYGDDLQHEWLENDDLDEIDTTVGCSRRLMTLVSQTSSLARKRRRAQVLIDNDFVDQCEVVRRGLEILQQKLPLAISSPKERFILQIAEIKRLTALLYFTENLGDLVPASPLPVTPFGGATTRWSFENDTPAPYISSNASTSSSKSSSSSSSSSSFSSPISVCKSWASTKQRLVSAIIELIKALPNSTTASIMWPLYIIGHSAGLEDEDQRRFVLERLTAIQATRNLGNVRQVRLSVERNFRTMHLDRPTAMPKGRATGVLRKRSGPTANGRIISLA